MVKRDPEPTLRLAMKSKADATRLARSVRGKQRHEHGNTTLSCPAPGVMTARIERSTPETHDAGYPYTLTIGCRLPKRKLH